MLMAVGTLCYTGPSDSLVPLINLLAQELSFFLILAHPDIQGVLK
jgi:hypothetical protein